MFGRRGTPGSDDITPKPFGGTSVAPGTDNDKPAAEAGENPSQAQPEGANPISQEAKEKL
ncbi:MAG: hypothetical protein JKY17_09565, partial [Magnetovibrio sp.]|nr:hypothetical protein [Magnetovibrio sp.]